MKKLIFVFAMILLLAVAFNSNAQQITSTPKEKPLQQMTSISGEVTSLVNNDLANGTPINETVQVKPAASPTEDFIGEHYEGGIIFYLDSTGRHGLIAAPVDQPGYAQWGITGLTGANFVDEGASNTKKIVSFMLMKKKPVAYWKITPAACMCDSSTLGGYSDWYLPSINELKSMYDKQSMIGAFTIGDYCSSTESSNNECWNIHFKPGKKIIFHDEKWRIDWNIQYNVRCIRKF
jgi:hypothetical protein